VDRDDRRVSVFPVRILEDAGPATLLGHLDVHPRLLLRHGRAEAVPWIHRLSGLALQDVERAALDVKRHRAVDDASAMRDVVRRKSN